MRRTLFALLIALAPATWAAPPTLTTLDNGLRVVVKVDRSAPVVAMQAWVLTGSVLEGRHMGSGLSHYFEHMLFKGTERLKVGDFSAAIRAAGGADVNAYTTYDRTVYHFTLRADKLDVGVTHLAEILTRATFPPAEVAKEMPVIHREMDQGADDPDDVGWRLFAQTMFTVHPYRHPVIGYRGVFDRLTRDDILEYYRARYSPSNMVWIVVGDVDPAAAVAKIKTAFAAQPRRVLEPLFVPAEPEPTAARVVEKRFAVEHTRLQVGWKTVAARHRDVPALDVLAAVLGQGDSARLCRELSDRQQLVTQITASSWTPRWPGVLSIEARCDDGKLAAVRKAIAAQVAAVQKDLVSDVELARARNKILADLVLEHQTAAAQAAQLGWALTVGGSLDHVRRYASAVAKVSAKNVRSAARRYLRPQRKVSVMLRPQLTTTVERATPPSRAKIETRMVTLKNGLRVLIRATPAVPAVHLTARGLGGTLFEPAAKGGSTNLMSELLTRGTQQLTAEQQLDRVEGVGGKLSGSGGSNTFGVTLDVLKADLELGLDVLSDCLRRPALRQADLDLLKRRFLARVKEVAESPWAVGGQRFAAAMFGDHPYARFSSGTLESLTAIQRADVVARFEQLVQPHNVVLAVYGDVDADTVLAEIRERFGDWTGRPLKVPTHAQPAHDKPVTVDHRDARYTQCVIRIGFPTVPILHADRIPLAVLSSVLDGMGSRLFRRLRDKASLAYSVGAASVCAFQGGSFAFYIVTTEAQREQALAGLRREIALAKTTITEAELARARQALIGEEVTQNATNAAQALNAVLNELYGAGYRAGAEDVARIEAVTLADLKRVATRYLDLGRAVTVVVGPPTPNHQATPAGTLKHGIALLKSDQHLRFLQTLVDPTQLAGLGRLETLATSFAATKARALLAVLERAAGQAPTLDAAGTTARWTTAEGRPLVLVRRQGKWYLQN